MAKIAESHWHWFLWLTFWTRLHDWCQLTVVLCYRTVKLMYDEHHGLHKMTYSDRLISLGIESLYCRRVKADLLMCYNILTNRVWLASSDFLTLSLHLHFTTYPRGNSMKLSKTRCITARDGHAFHKRVINIWNALPECVVSANSISSFKRFA